jgi:hypothetical protein
MTGRPRIRVSNRTGCALPQLRTSAKFHSSAKCHKCQPHAGSDDVSYDPIRSPTLLKDRRRVGAHHDVGQRSAQRGMARRPEVGEKCVQLLVAVPDIGAELADVTNRRRVLELRELVDRQRRRRHDWRSTGLLAHRDNPTRPHHRESRDKGGRWRSSTDAGRDTHSPTGPSSPRRTAR